MPKEQIAASEVDEAHHAKGTGHKCHFHLGSDCGRRRRGRRGGCSTHGVTERARQVRRCRSPSRDACLPLSLRVSFFCTAVTSTPHTLLSHAHASHKSDTYSHTHNRERRKTGGCPRGLPVSAHARPPARTEPSMPSRPVFLTKKLRVSEIDPWRPSRRTGRSPAFFSSSAVLLPPPLCCLLTSPRSLDKRLRQQSSRAQSECAVPSKRAQVRRCFEAVRYGAVTDHSITRFFSISQGATTRDTPPTRTHRHVGWYQATWCAAECQSQIGLSIGRCQVAVACASRPSMPLPRSPVHPNRAAHPPTSLQPDPPINGHHRHRRPSHSLRAAPRRRNLRLRAS